MAFYKKTMARCNVILQFLDGFVFKLDHRITAGANQMIVVFPFHHMFIAGLSVVQQHFPGQSGFDKQFERAVNRGAADSGVSSLDFKIQLFNADMLVGGKEKIEDNVTLTGGAKAFAGGKPVEGALFFENHPPSA
jgi:hypothetical protein